MMSRAATAVVLVIVIAVASDVSAFTLRSSFSQSLFTRPSARSITLSAYLDSPQATVNAGGLSLAPSAEFRITTVSSPATIKSSAARMVSANSISYDPIYSSSSTLLESFEDTSLTMADR